MGPDTLAREREALQGVGRKAGDRARARDELRDDRRAGGSKHVAGLQGRHRGTQYALLHTQIRSQEGARTPFIGWARSKGCGGPTI
jgi:hypothetical protein